jgi:hypothetical protein
MSGATLLRPLYAFMAQVGKTLLYLTSISSILLLLLLCYIFILFSAAPPDRTMRPEVDSASESEYQGFLVG